MIVWSTPRGTLALPGLTSIRYGAAASTLLDRTKIADRPCLRKRGPSVKSASAATAITPMVTACRRSGWRSTLRPQSIAWHLAMADSTRRWTSSRECGELSDAARRLASIALMISACSDGSCSSRYNATCSSETRQSSGRTMNQPSRLAKAIAIRTRKVMIEAGLNRHDSRPQADSASAAAPRPSTPTAPRSISL